MKIENFPAVRQIAQRDGRREVPLITNLMKADWKFKQLHYYEVGFLPDIMRNKVQGVFDRIYNENKNDMPLIAFDGIKMLVSTEKFGNKTYKYGKDDNYVMEIVYKATHDFTNMSPSSDLAPHISCLEIIARHFQKNNYVSEGQKVFSDAFGNALDSCVEIRTGLFHIIKNTNLGWFLNIDLSFGSFFKAQSLLDLIKNLYEESENSGRRDNRRDDRRGGGDYNRGRRESNVDLSRVNLSSGFWSNIDRHIRNVRMKTNHRSLNNQRELSFKVSGIVQKPANNIQFEIDGVKTSVADYFAKTYKPLKFPNFPVVCVKKRGMEMYFPVEVLEILPSQRYAKKLNEQQTASLIKIAAKAPKERFRAIEDKISELKVLKNPLIDSFGLVFDNKFADCKGKILEPPKIQYGNITKSPENGSWNLMGAKAYSAKEVPSCAVFVFRQPRANLEDALRSMVNIARNYGVTFSSKPQIVRVDSVEHFRSISKPPFCIVILPDKSSQRYEEIKKICETHTNVISQCILESNIIKLEKPAFVSNVLLKINVKLGGVNSVLTRYSSVLDKPTLIIGVDVNHPGIGDMTSPSIVAIVGSINNSVSAFHTIIKQQERRQEIVQDFDADVRKLLIGFYKSTGKKPEQIVIFRDGIGESMVKTVFQQEIIAIKDACGKIEPGYSPKLTFIVAQKRHSIRFCTTGQSRNPRDNGNVQPGTVIDDIGHPSLFDFYLVSHFALQGTASPVRYIVLLNENNYDSNTIYEFVYGLCHMYARATKSVSVVPSIYYAHLAAFRGKAYLDKSDDGQVVMRQFNNSLNNKLFYV